MARVVHPALPADSFRTYHPAYLMRAGDWDVIAAILDEIAGVSGVVDG